MNSAAYKKTLSIAIIISIILISFSVMVGSIYIPFSEVLAIIVKAASGIDVGIATSEVNEILILSLRLPRTILCFLVGAALSLCGQVLQSTLKNPLASAYSLGISSACGLMAVIVMIFYTGAFMYQIMITLGILGGVGCVVIVLVFAKVSDSTLASSTVILSGMVISLFLNAVMTCLASMDTTIVTSIFLFQLGSFAQRGYTGIIALSIILPIILIIFITISKNLDILSFGDDEARVLGVNAPFLKWLCVVLVSILTSVCVSFVGIIGFVDLIVPHIVRRLVGASHKKTIPLNIFIGGSFMLVCDIIARVVISPREVPIGAVTALIGAPFFAFVYLKNKRGQSDA